MSRTTAPTPPRWRRRRTLRVAVAVALVVAAPLVERGSRDGPPSADPVTAAADAGPAPSAHAGPGPAGAPGADVRLVPVPLTDPALADLLRPGDLVDLVATGPLTEPDPHPVPRPGHDEAGADVVADPSAGEPVFVARGARVRDAPAGRQGARSLFVEVPAEQAARVATSAALTPLAVVVHG